MLNRLRRLRLRFSDPGLEAEWKANANQRVEDGLKWGTFILGLLLVLSSIRDVILQWDGWQALMMFRLFVIAPIFLSPWLLSRTQFGQHHREAIVVLFLSILFISLAIMFVWLPNLPWANKPLIAILFLPILAGTVTISPIGFRSTLILCLVGQASFSAAYYQIESSVIEFSIMSWSVFGLGGILLGASWRLERQERLTWLARRDLEGEQRKGVELLHNVFPEEIATRLLNAETPIADRYNALVVIFADVVGFTPMARQMPATELIQKLDGVFSDFDSHLHAQRFTKVKTIGDAYMAVGGLPWEPADNRARAGARLAWDLISCAEQEHQLQLRVGMHIGPCVGGVIGKERFIYDFWGETVNLASRLESSGEVGRVQVSEAIREALKDDDGIESAGIRELKGVGSIQTYYLAKRPDE